MKQPVEYFHGDKLRTFNQFLGEYGVNPTGDHLADLTATTIHFRVDNADTPEELHVITSGRYDGTRFIAATGKISPNPTYQQGEAG